MKGEEVRKIIKEQEEANAKEFAELETENGKIRTELSKLIGIDNPLYSPLWVLVNKLINNEIEQEGYCNN